MTQLLSPDTTPTTPGSATPGSPALPAAPAVAEPHVGTCAECGRSALGDRAVLSQHRTSEGTIVYTRCDCGALQVRLQRPDRGERVIATGRP